MTRTFKQKLRVENLVRLVADGENTLNVPSLAFIVRLQTGEEELTHREREWLKTLHAEHFC